jgi:hypothetical protein
MTRDTDGHAPQTASVTPLLGYAYDAIRTLTRPHDSMLSLVELTSMLNHVELAREQV